MAAKAGRALRIKYDADGAGAGASAVIAGARTDTVSVANEPIDITDKDDAGIQTLLNDIGKQSFAMSVEGVMKDDTLAELAFEATASAALHIFDIDVLGFGTLRGQWFIQSFEAAGAEGTDPGTFSCSLVSSGAITYTAA